MEELVKSTKTGIGTVGLYRSGIMHQTYDGHTEISMGLSTAEMEFYKKEYCRGRKRPIPVDIRYLPQGIIP